MKTARILLIVIFAGLLTVACKSNKEVTVEREMLIIHDTVRETRRDTLRQISFQRDTLYSRDSIYVEMRGDTLIREVFRYRYRDRLVTDTLYRAIGDTLTEKAGAENYLTRTVRETVEVERKLRWWQTLLQWTGGLCWGFFLLFAIYALIKYKKKG